MAKKTKVEKKLTEYESRQVEKVAAWKSEYPNPFGELFRRAAQPVAKVVEFIIPDRVALLAIEAAYRASDLAATRGDVKAQAEGGDSSGLRHEPLEVCDRLSRRVGMLAQGIATVEGALTGLGGILTTVLDVPLLFTLCLRTIIKTGRCYGYPLDRPTDKAWVLGALVVALSSTKERRIESIARLREIEELLIEETQEQVVVEEAASLLTQIEVFEGIPVFGAVTGSLLNLSVAHRVEVSTRRLFQERWLRDRGKVDVIEPAPVKDKLPSRPGWSGAFARAGYSTVYGLGFGVALPACLAAAILAPAARPFARSLRDGARVVGGGAERLLGGFRGLIATDQPEPSGHGVLVPAQG